tara:strand:- start:2876 stop:2983 length:108 start_codon:yes stop_codon:yes gene_type:complete
MTTASTVLADIFLELLIAKFSSSVYLLTGFDARWF